MSNYNKRLYKYTLISGVVLGLLATGSYKVSADQRNQVNGNNNAHIGTVVSHKGSSFVQMSADQTTQQPVVSQSIATKYHRILSGMNNYYGTQDQMTDGVQDTSLSHSYIMKYLRPQFSNHQNQPSSKKSDSNGAFRNHSQKQNNARKNKQPSHLISGLNRSNDRDRNFKLAAISAKTRHHQNQSNSNNSNNSINMMGNVVSNWFRDGLNNAELQARNYVSVHESGNRWNVLSYGSPCIGYFQLNPAYLGYVNGRPNLDPQHQVRVADRYVQSRYGGWLAAKAFWLTHRWY